MSYTPSQRSPKALQARYQDVAGLAACWCELEPDAPAVATKKLGLKRVAGTAHQALHKPWCPHSELVVTAFALTTPAKKRARRIAVECWRRRHGRR